MNLSILSKKKIIYYVFISIAFFLLVMRFFYLQIYKQAHYFLESEKNRIREVVLQPMRGIFYDRNGMVLVDNDPSYSVYTIPFEIKKLDSVLIRIGSILELSPEEIRQKVSKGQSGIFSPVKIKEQISFKELTAIEENRLELPGIIWDTEPRRNYPSGVRAPHVFGYLGEVDKRELKNLDNKIYRQGDIVGKKGLEKIYDVQLKGLRGYRYMEVDALGREVRKLSEKPEIALLPGKNLHLAMDLHLQRFLETRMDTLRGGAVVVDCRNGEVLALVSKPDFDLELFTRPLTTSEWNSLLNNPAKPLYDRMVQSVFPPGSTFKLVLATAALETESITVDWSNNCPGFFQFGRRTFECWKKKGHGKLELIGAIEQSCNVYFYKLGLKVGLEPWADFARKYRFGIPTGIDLMEESPGIVPNTAYLDKVYGKDKWSKGLIVNLAVGQGDLLVTPLQLASMAMILANKGVYYRFHLVRFIEDPVDETKIYTPVDSVKIDGISETVYDIVREGMYEVVNGEHGTARSCWFPDIKVAGKTGTAQNPPNKDHAWFVGFAPFEKPEIAFCVLVENGGGGGAVAAPIARGIIQNYFKDRSAGQVYVHDAQ